MERSGRAEDPSVESCAPLKAALDCAPRPQVHSDDPQLRCDDHKVGGVA